MFPPSPLLQGAGGKRRLCPASALSNWRKIKSKAAGEQSVTVIASQQGQSESGPEAELAGFLPRCSRAGRWPGGPSFFGESWQPMHCPPGEPWLSLFAYLLLDLCEREHVPVWPVVLKVRGRDGQAQLE